MSGNPVASIPGSALFGTPISEAEQASHLMRHQRAMATVRWKIGNNLFYMNKIMIAFGDAKTMVKDIDKAIE